MKTKTPLGVDNIPTKLVKLTSKEMAGPFSDLINKTIINSSFFPTSEKIASVTLAFKMGDRLKKETCGPISVVNVFSKIFERFMLNQMLPYSDSILSVFVSTYSC